MSRLGNIDELPMALRKQLRHKAAKPGPEAVVIDALKSLEGVATTDELLVQQYRLHKAIPAGRRQFTALLYRMAKRELIEKRAGRTGLWALSNHKVTGAHRASALTDPLGQQADAQGLTQHTAHSGRKGKR